MSSSNGAATAVERSAEAGVAERGFTLVCPAPLAAADRVLLGHGSGGKLTADLIARCFLPAFRNEYLEKLDDHAVLGVDGARIALTTDAYVVSPLFFPGGDIGMLAVNGTVNDLATAGARPMWIAAAFILEEGFLLGDLERIVASMRRAAEAAHVLLVTGDTKVVERGKADGCYITTTGVGVLAHDGVISADRARPGDAIVLSGPIAEHGIAVMATRAELALETPVVSDTAPVHELVLDLLAAGAELHCLRDPTRGGLATTLVEIATRSRVGMVIDERAIPVREPVRGVCELLGLDPLYVANEGKVVIIVPGEQADDVFARLRAHPAGRGAAVIGGVVEDPEHLVVLETGIGRRIVDVLPGEQLPRIC